MNLPRQFKKFIKEWVIPFIIVIAVTSPVRSSIIDMNHVPSGSMRPTIKIGDNLLINKLAYDLKIPFSTTHLVSWANPKRGDIVVFYSPKRNIRMVKRVVGIPGDTIQLVNNRLKVNRKKLTYENALITNLNKPNEIIQSEYFGEKQHLIMEQPMKLALRNTVEYVVPTDKYFLMGDNRDNSHDSRFYGFVSRKSIIGRAERVIYSKVAWAISFPIISRFLKKLI